MQSPPAASTAAPTSAALRDCAATMPPLLAIAGLRMVWLLENWSCMAPVTFLVLSCCLYSSHIRRKHQGSAPMPRHIACLTFDFDAMSGMIAWGLTSPTPISRGEFGAIGVGRILALLAKYDIKTTFFIPGMVIGTYPQICERIVADGHEVGHHGWTHVPPAKMNPDQEEAGLIRGIEAIRRISGQD